MRRMIRRAVRRLRLATTRVFGGFLVAVRWLWLALTGFSTAMKERKQEMRSLLLVVGALFASFLVIMLIKGFSVAAVIILALLFLWGLLGLRQVKQEERWVIELFGKYCWTLKPGLNWIAPWIMEVRAIVSIWELTLSLFGEETKIDFKDGSAVPKNAVVFVQIKCPDDRYGAVGILGRSMTGVERAIYEVANWRTFAQDLVENAVRTFLNRMTIDEAITLAKPGYDLVNHDPDIGLPNEELERIEGALAGWGFELKRITIQDFDLEPELVRARGEVQIRKKEAEAAKFVAQRRSEEIFGAIVEMLARSRGKKAEDIVKEIDEDPELRKEFLELAKDLLTRRMAIDGGSFIDVRVGGTEGMEATFLALAAAWKQMEANADRRKAT